MAAYAIQHLGLFMQDKPKKVAFLGPVFTKALQPIAEALQVLAVPQVSKLGFCVSGLKKERKPAAVYHYF